MNSPPTTLAVLLTFLSYFKDQLPLLEDALSYLHWHDDSEARSTVKVQLAQMDRYGAYIELDNKLLSEEKKVEWNTIRTEWKAVSDKLQPLLVE